MAGQASNMTREQAIKAAKKVDGSVCKTGGSGSSNQAMKKMGNKS